MRPLVFRRVAALAMLVAIGCSVGACERDRAGVVRVAVIGDDPPSLSDPAIGTLSAPDAVLLASSAQGLVRFDARGQIEPGLAERWTVTDDGLSYIFRLAAAEWPNGRKVTAQQVARLIRRQLAPGSNNPLKDALGAVEEVVAMTDGVIEIRLISPRPNLLQLLAQPELAVVRDGQGTGPFLISERLPGNALRLERRIADEDGEEDRLEEVLLNSAAAPQAITAFNRGAVDLVLGGTFVDLPTARSGGRSSDAVQFDPAAGLFGLVPTREDGLLAEPEIRQLLSQAIDRQALLERFQVPGLLPRATLLQPGLEGITDVPAPAWAAAPTADRRAALVAEASRLIGGTEEPPVLRVALPEGPGSDLLLDRLRLDWGVLGISVERARSTAAADLKVLDAVSPSTSPAWFLRQFRCEVAAVCDDEADALIEAARAATVPAQRGALFGQAARLLDEAQVFIPIAAPIRWSLVAPRIQGFAGNRFARHTLTGLREPLRNERVQ